LLRPEDWLPATGGDDVTYYTCTLIWRKRFDLPGDIVIDYDKGREVDDNVRILSFTGWGLSVVGLGQEIASDFDHRDMQEPIVEGALRSLIVE
jgi:hypothetical protein